MKEEELNFDAEKSFSEWRESIEHYKERVLVLVEAFKIDAGSTVGITKEDIMSSIRGYNHSLFQAEAFLKKNDPTFKSSGELLLEEFEQGLHKEG